MHTKVKEFDCKSSYPYFATIVSIIKLNAEQQTLLLSSTIIQENTMLSRLMPKLQGGGDSLIISGKNLDEIEKEKFKASDIALLAPLSQNLLPLHMLLEDVFSPSRKGLIDFAICAIQKDSDSVDILKYLIGLGFPREIKDEDDRTLLHYAAYFVKTKAQFIAMFELFNLAGVLSRDRFGDTALHLAVYGENAVAIKVLLEKESRLFSIPNQEGHIPFEKAIESKHSASLLLAFKQYLEVNLNIPPIPKNSTIIKTAVIYNSSDALRIISEFHLSSLNYNKSPNLKELAWMFRSYEVEKELDKMAVGKNLEINHLTYIQATGISIANVICNNVHPYFIIPTLGAVLQLSNPLAKIKVLETHAATKAVIQIFLSFAIPILISPKVLSYCNKHASLYSDSKITSLNDAYNFFIYHNGVKEPDTFEYLVVLNKCPQEHKVISEFYEDNHKYVLCKTLDTGSPSNHDEL